MGSVLVDRILNWCDMRFSKVAIGLIGVLLAAPASAQRVMEEDGTSTLVPRAVAVIRRAVMR